MDFRLITILSLYLYCKQFSASSSFLLENMIQYDTEQLFVQDINHETLSLG